VDFHFVWFALLLCLNGAGQGLFSATNTSGIMSSVPVADRGAASGMRATFLNSGTALSIGIFFSLMTSGLGHALPSSLSRGLRAQGVSRRHGRPPGPPASRQHPVRIPGRQSDTPSAGATGTLASLPAHNVATLTGSHFFPTIISGPFRHGPFVVFIVASIMAAIAAIASALRGPSRPNQAAGIVLLDETV
jgi:hypothetical protein